jgi:pimeloyl-ACP methyl ester carboxylesterase
VSDRARGRSTWRRALVGGAALAGVVAAVAVERRAVRRARAHPDPARGEPLAERPGPERRIASFDGTELAVNVTGPPDAPILVFSHGFSIDMTAWHYQWKELSRDYRCVLYDQRGHGQSSLATGGDYSLDALAKDLMAVLDAEARVGPVVLIGHSMGGIAVLAFASRFPDEFGSRVEGVVLADTTASNVVEELVGQFGLLASAAGWRAVQRLARNPRLVYRLRARALDRGADLAFLVARLTNFNPEAPASLVDYVVGVAARAPAEVWTHLMASLVDVDLRPALGNVTVPALVIVGDGDRLTPPGASRALQRALPDARLAVIPRAGHAAMLERHREFNSIVSAFLRETIGRRRERAPA